MRIPSDYGCTYGGQTTSAQGPRPGAADPVQTTRVRPHQAPPRRRVDHRRSAPHRQDGAPPRRRSTTPTVPPRTSCPSSAPDKPSATSSFIRRSCATSPTWPPDGTCWASRSSLPFAIAPTGFTRLMHTEGEIAGARAAAAAGIPFSLSTLGTCAIEDVVTAVPQGRKWFQLYMWRDRDRSMALVKRAADAGFDTLLVTVDVPVSGARLRDNRNGMTIPPALTLRTVLDAVPHPKLVVRSVDHRTAGIRVAGSLVGHRRRVPEHHVRPQPHLRRSGVDQGAHGRASSW